MLHVEGYPEITIATVMTILLNTDFSFIVEVTGAMIAMEIAVSKEWNNVWLN
jgi:hypothetical protein